MKTKDFHTKFDVTKYKIYENGSWIWSLRPKQLTYCSSLISLKRPAASLLELNEAEFRDYGDVVHKLEGSINKYTTPTLYNYLSLMLVDSYVHFHVLPRYRDELEDELEFKRDVFFPRQIDLALVSSEMSTPAFLESLTTNLLAVVEQDGC